MAEHSPAPWYYRFNPEGEWYEIIDADDESVADTEGMTDADEANARFIAAAPVLLAALEEIDAFERDGEAMPPGEARWEYYRDGARRWNAILDNVRTAIAKARGE